MVNFVNSTKSEYVTVNESDNKQTMCNLIFLSYSHITAIYCKDQAAIIQLPILVLTDLALSVGTASRTTYPIRRLMSHEIE